MLNLFIGPMFSGKTTMLLNRFEQYKELGKKCIIIKYDLDNRYTNTDELVTHDNYKINAKSTNLLINLNIIIKEFDIILIDEIQFYKDAYRIVDIWSNSKIVECYGLNGDFNRKPFEQISYLIALCDNITFLKAKDKYNGENAIFTHRIVESEEKELIGGSDYYEPLSRINYIKKKKYKLFTNSR